MFFIYFAPLFLYFPKLIPTVETQPLVFVLLSLVGIILSKNQTVAPRLIFLSLGLLTWVTMWTIGSGKFAGSFGLAQLLIGPLVFFGFLAINSRPPPRKYLAVIALYFATLAVVEFTFPNYYESFASLLIDRASATDGHRGVSLLTPEPTYAVITIAYFLIISIWSGRWYGFRFKWIEVVFLGCLIATFSTYMVVIFLALLFSIRPKLVLTLGVVSIIVIPLFSIVSLSNDEGSRVAVAISRILSADYSNFLPSISLLDNSLGSRLITFFASINAPINFPWGLGIDCTSMARAIDGAGYNFAYNNSVIKSVIDHGCLKPQSYISSVFLGLGIMSLVYLSGLYFLVRRSVRLRTDNIWIVPLSVSGVLLIVQSQITNPIPWILMYVAFSNNQQGSDFLVTNKYNSRNNIAS